MCDSIFEVELNGRVCRMRPTSPAQPISRPSEHQSFHKCHSGSSSKQFLCYETARMPTGISYCSEMSLCVTSALLQTISQGSLILC